MGALTDLEREVLYSTSMSYIANSHPEAVAISEAIGVHHPSNLCGPLSATFLISTGILPADTETFDFWFLDPVDDDWRLWTWFPSDNFERHDFAQRVGTFDFKQFPLYPGDFLYLFGSPNGAFDHIMVVTRVDEEGRAYSVTNIRIGEWPDGFGEFVIKEVMLYDPNNPGIGQFADYNKLNWTGFGWFVIRKK
jgi:hypothetical protein